MFATRVVSAQAEPYREKHAGWPVRQALVVTLVRRAQEKRDKFLYPVLLYQAI